MDFCLEGFLSNSGERSVSRGSRQEAEVRDQRSEVREQKTDWGLEILDLKFFWLIADG